MTTAVFVGDGTLLVRCAGAWLEAGHDVNAIASHNASILDWARSNSILAVPLDADSAIEIPDVAFDYLFSVANLRVLPKELIARAKKLAVNFHDAPLPRHAGLNATSWALLERERVHGVTWHEMTAAVDAGRVVRQACFEIAPEETAFSLNARCYEAGLATFMDLLGDIARGALGLTPQQGHRTYFGRDRRPVALATLDFAQPAAQLAALARALDFGSYPNPLARAKVYLGAETIVVGSAAVAETASGAAPGTVLGIEGDTLRVATGKGDLLLSGCLAPRGLELAQAIAPGTILPALDPASAGRLAERMPDIARGEAMWTHVLAAAAPVALPYPSQPLHAAGARDAGHRIALQTPAAGAATVAAFFAWLSALTGQERISALYCDAPLAEQAQGLEAWLTPWVPLTLATCGQTQAVATAAAAEVQIARARKAGPCTRDLRWRLGDKGPDLAAVGRIGVSLGHAARPHGMELLLSLEPSGHGLELQVDGDRFSRATADLMARHLRWWLSAFAGAAQPVARIPLVPPEEANAIAAINATSTPLAAGCIHEAVAAQAARTGSQTAISGSGGSLSYEQLEREATALALRLRAGGVVAGDTVGLCLERTPDLLVALLAILKAGAAYLPLDPAYPRDRIDFMIADSGTRLVVTSAALAARLPPVPGGRTFLVDGPPPDAPQEGELPAVSPDRPAYVIYTSGSTGRPKGVVVSHANAMNFFAGMAQRIPRDPPGRWLAVTSLSFDISLLELCWTLAQGFTVVLHADTEQPAREAPAFSLFYFASDSSGAPAERYRLLLEGAKFADREGFCAIWTPERHFHAFGGLYPNPALTSAAIAAVTTRLQIRAGSCVLPLHHPIRVAEEWAFVDNISQGRVGVSFASGWQPNDFAIAPAAFADRKNAMLANIDVVRRLWRGESVAFPGPLGQPVDVRTLPRPVQPELPVWLTAAGNPETFQQAGAMGCHLLTHLLGQSLADVAEKIGLYRQAWRQAGHSGDGHVTLMLHAFVGDDEDAVRETVRQPLKDYLRSSVDLIRQAAWSFPTFVQRGAANGKTAVEIMDAAPLSGEEMDALLEHAFARYYGSSGLFGTPQRCLATVNQLSEAGVDEIACLIDFGIPADTVLAHLRHLKALMDACGQQRFAPRRASVADEILRHGITHFQCTPSMASMLVADAAGRAALSRLQVLMVGGEALAPALARELRALVPGVILNMYGPTETTVWSTTADLAAPGDFVPLGQPIANTRLSVRNAWDAECPAGVPGELLIGGAGVAQGYWKRPELTAERFIADGLEPGERWYRTGDLVRRHPDGTLEFLGRLDHQVKLRGHRIELGEIESTLARQPGVAQAVVVARPDATGNQSLVGYVTGRAGVALDPETLRGLLARELPDVMVPAQLVVLQALPLTPNGKVDRRALPAPRSGPAPSAATAPQGELENTIAAIWQEVLGLDRVDTTENFFDLGGHSLLVVQVQRRLREACGQEVSITDMFRLPTVRALAAHLGGNTANSAVDDGLNRAKARRQLRSRAAAQPAPVA